MQTEKTRRRYNRLSPLYNLVERGLGHGSNRWRQDLFAKIKGPKVLEVGWVRGSTCLTIPRGFG